MEAFICLAEDHDWRLVLLAGCVCFLATTTAVSLFHQARFSRGAERWGWLSLDAAAAGYGIWATHFIAILAYNPAFAAEYHLGLTLFSLFLAILITGAGLVVAGVHLTLRSACLGGAIIGLGVAVMHFTGMYAIDLPGKVTWSPVLVGVSIAFGAICGSLALLAARNSDWASSILASLWATLAVVLTHFTAMAAMTFVPDPARIAVQSAMTRQSVVVALAAGAALILGICLVAAFGERQSKDKLHKQKLLLDAALSNMAQGLCMCDAEGRILLCNDRYLEISRLSREEIAGKSLLDQLKKLKLSGMFDGDPEQFFSEIVDRMRNGQTNSRIIHTGDKRTIFVIERPMQGGGWVSTVDDITEWERVQAQIEHMARHDALTDLPNRTLFSEQLELALHRATRNEHVAVLCLDLDHFKDVNDTLGHPIGDELLRAVARRLTDCVRKSDTVARFGGDEFAIVQVGPETQPVEASALAARIVEKMSLPFDLQGHQVVIGTSVGISVAPDDGTTAEQLLRNADMALYLAKEDGRGAYRFFEVGMDAKAQARRLLFMDLRKALGRNEFEVFYQPIYDLAKDRIIAFEALLRWNHPLRGIILPGNFIALAEETGLIIPIGHWVLQQACADAASWPEEVSVAVNLSPVQFKSRMFVATVMTAVDSSGLDPHRLELEITESALLQDNETTLSALHQLRDFGIRISMDDFGTGYSSLSYLRSFPFDKIKIDQSFVHELSAQGDSMAIVRAVTGLGKSLGITTTAEGVETDEQLDLLRKEGCGEVQGFLLSAPRPAAEVEKMLATQRSRGVA